jgi:PPOX class probable F420-dependent enzyme
MATTFDEVSKAQYVSLTTFTRDGRPKPTAIWIARDGDRALVITEKNSWKVKRIRNTPRVTLAVCDMRGNVKGEPVEAVATVLDDSETESVYQAINKRYGLVGRIFNFFSKLRVGNGRTVGLEIRAA